MNAFNETYKEYQLYLEQNEQFKYKLLELWYHPNSGKICVSTAYINSVYPTLKTLRDNRFTDFIFIEHEIIGAYSNGSTVVELIVSKNCEYYDDIRVPGTDMFYLPEGMKKIVKDVLSNNIATLTAIYNAKKTLSHDDEMPDVGDIFD